MTKKSTKREEPLEYLTTASNDAEPGMLEEMLKEHGINILIKKAAFSAAYYLGHNLDLRCDIFVLSSELERAKLLIKPIDG